MAMQELQTPSPSQPPHVAIIPSPGMGHLIPLLELSKRLVHRHHFTVTFLTPENPAPAHKSFLASLPAGITSVILPPVNFDDLPSDTRIETIITLTVTRSLPALRDVLSRLKSTTNLVAIVTDLFGTDAFDVAEELSVPPYIFFPSTATTLSLALYLPELDRTVNCEYRDLPNPVQIPGCIPIQGKDLLDPVQDRKNQAYSCVLHNCKRYSLAHGILVNSFEAIEPGPIKALRESGLGKPPVYPVGPLTKAESDEPDPAGCLRWLDSQPGGSVLFVSFGSGGTLSWLQMTEVAAGLEMSRQRFLWVVRSPSDANANATYFSVDSKAAADPLTFLPEGWAERVKEVGKVVPSWAPQVTVLNHEATGGFLTHCGWNSTLESVAHGVPMVAWPLYAEQKMNAVMLTEEVRVAIKPRAAAEDGVVRREEIARVVRELMEGEEGKELRSRVKKLQEEAAAGLAEEGSSFEALAEVAERWKSNAAVGTAAGLV